MTVKFNPISGLEVGFRGRYSLPPVGHPQKDRQALEKLGEIFPNMGIIHYPYSDHSGTIIKYDGDKKPIREGGSRLKDSISFPGDGIIITREIQSVVAIRSRDCVPLIGYTDKEIFGIHLSNKNLCGGANQPILKTLFELINPEECRIFIGPSIGGVLSRCTCYEYTQTEDKPDGTRLINTLNRVYPGIKININDSYFFRKKKRKLIINWGKLIISLVGYCGVPVDQINATYNCCTKCGHEWYSQRHEGVDPLGTGNLSWIRTSKETDLLGISYLS